MPAGRPSKFQPEFIGQAAKLCALGATDVQLAEFFDVAVSTVALWKVQHSEFSDAIRVPKAVADERVAQSLYMRATGYVYTEQQAFKVRTSATEEAIEVVEVQRLVPPETTAMIFWLKNRQPAQWRDRVEHTGAEGGPIETSTKIDLTGVPLDQLRALATLKIN